VADAVIEGYEAVDKIMTLFESLPAKPERWKPGKDAGYYVIVADGNIDYEIWEGDDSDLQSWGFGNCFQTREEAEYARDKIKEVLSNFHKNHD
jgi:hypothetical protein